MDFDFTREQVMLRDVTREVLARESPASAVRRWMEDDRGYDPELWHRLAETGLLGIAVDEAHGGQGLGMVELALVLDEMGRGAYPGPYFASSVLAAGLLMDCGDATPQGLYLTGLADGSLVGTVAISDDGLSWGPSGVTLSARADGDEFVLAGAKRFIPWSHVADVVLVAARSRRDDDPTHGITIFAVERGTPGVTIVPHRSIDRTSRSADVSFDGARLGRESIVCGLDMGWPLVESTLARAAIGASADMLGAARRCLQMSVEYAKIRQQFGQQIGAFQAIKHMCADMLLEVENAHAATYYAAWALDAGAPDAGLAASVAKSYVNEGARKVCGSAVQVHGGIGFTWDYDLHLYFKRAKGLEPLYGNTEFHREQIVRAALDAAAIPALA